MGPTQTQTRISVRQLDKSYGRRPALRGISFDLYDGVTALVGPNGSGKSTLMRAIVGIGGWDAGTISVDGVDPCRCPKAARAKIGYMPERVSLPPETRVQSYLGYAAKAKGLRSAAAEAEVEFVLAAVGIKGDWRKRLIGNLSKGYKERVGLAQAMLGRPGLLALDEPVSGLDPVNLRDVQNSIRAYADGGRSVLISTHQLNQVRVLADRVLVVSDGSILYDGPIAGMSLGAEGTSTIRIVVRDNALSAPLELVLAAINGTVLEQAGGDNGCRVIRVELSRGRKVGEMVRTLVEHDWAVESVEPITDPLEVAFRVAVEAGRDASEPPASEGVPK